MLFYMDKTNTEAKTPKMVDLFAAAKPNGYPNWNPVTHPYRVSYDRSSSYDGSKMHETAVFATEAEARAAFVAIMPKCATRATIDLAINVEVWSDRGHWQRVDSRKRGSLNTSK